MTGFQVYKAIKKHFLPQLPFAYSEFTDEEKEAFENIAKELTKEK